MEFTLFLILARLSDHVFECTSFAVARVKGWISTYGQIEVQYRTDTKYRNSERF